MSTLSELAQLASEHGWWRGLLVRFPWSCGDVAATPVALPLCRLCRARPADLLRVVVHCVGTGLHRVSTHPRKLLGIAEVLEESNDLGVLHQRVLLLGLCVTDIIAATWDVA